LVVTGGSLNVGTGTTLGGALNVVGASRLTNTTITGGLVVTGTTTLAATNLAFINSNLNVEIGSSSAVNAAFLDFHSNDGGATATDYDTRIISYGGTAGSYGQGRLEIEGLSTIIMSNVDSTSNNTGALQIIGGVGVGGSINLGGDLSINTSTTIPFTINDTQNVVRNVSYSTFVNNFTKDIVVNADSNYYASGVNANATVYKIRFGFSDDSNLEGSSYWAASRAMRFSVQGGSSSATNEIMVLDGRGLVGINTTAPSLTSALHVVGNVLIDSTTASTSAATGALNVNGGVGVDGSIYSGGKIVVNNTSTGINMLVRCNIATNGNVAGIGFGVTTSTDVIKGAIIHERTGGFGTGTLHLANRASTDNCKFR
jgi:hypothetical protein